MTQDARNGNAPKVAHNVVGSREHDMYVVVKEVLRHGKDFFVNTEKWDDLQTFALEQLVCLMEQWNRCVKVAVGKVTGCTTLENFHYVSCRGVVPHVGHGGIPPTNTFLVA